MTIATDLALAKSTRRRYYLKIDGVDKEFWQNADDGSYQEDWHKVLHPPREHSSGLNLGSMKIDLGQMTFRLQEFKNSDGSRYFAQLFAPARWENQTVGPWLVAPADDHNEQIDANAVNIPLRHSAGLEATPGTFYAAGETLNAANLIANTLTGALRGLHPAIGNTATWARTWDRPMNTDAAWHQYISHAPFALHGRRVGFYVTTWDKTTGDWNYPGTLLWPGRVSHSIKYIPQKDQWLLSCKSIMEDLEHQICLDLAEDQMDLINLEGYHGRDIHVTEFDGSSGFTIVCSGEVEIAAAGSYTLAELKKEVRQNLASMSLSGGTQTIHMDLNDYAGDGTVQIRAWSKTADRVVEISFYNDGPHKYPCHPLFAIGFRKEDFGDKSYLAASGGEYELYFKPSGDVYEAYMGLHPNVNGRKVNLKDGSKFWPDQGDYDVTAAHMIIEKVHGAKKHYDAIPYVLRYSSITSDVATLTVKQPQEEYDKATFAGQIYGDDPIKIKQAYVPSYNDGAGTIRGPYEMLLFPLLSTGTENYNHSTYDKMPLVLSIGVQAALVDVDSFLAADAAISGEPLAWRDGHIYSIQEPISWYDLLLREAMLFGHTLVWNNGKLRIRDVLLPEVQGWSVTLGDASRANPTEKPPMEMSIDTVVNQYECEIIFDLASGKFDPPVIITDVASAQQLGKKRVKISHPGLPGSNSLPTIKALVEETVLGRPLRYPSQILTVSLQPQYVDQVGIGDVIKYTGSYTPNPLGDGTLTSSILALVLNKNWNYDAGSGSVMLMLLSQYVSYGDPWAPSGLVDINATDNGGWNATDKTLSLNSIAFGTSGDSDDGAAVAPAGSYRVNVIERNPANVDNPTRWLDQAAAFAYETNGEGILSLSADLNGFDLNKEHIVTFSDYPTAIAGMLTRGTWQANSTTLLLNSATKAQRYG